MVKSVRFGIFISTIILWCLFAGSARAEELVISEEFSGPTANSSMTLEESSSESQFTTVSAPSIILPLAVSDEISFRTTTTTVTLGELTISDELTFKTDVQSEIPVNPPDDDGGGGGGSGGGSGGSGGFLRVPLLAESGDDNECPVYLTKFIRFGADNDPNEVRKLQIFLRDYEGFANLLATGVYDQATFEAVKIFQLRYREAILKPWGIDYPTGYVYITTTLAINNLHCERDPANGLNLRDRRLLVPSFDQEFIIPTTTPTTTLPEVGQLDRSFFQLAALGLLDFIRNHPWWWTILVLIVLVIILFFNFNSDSGEKKRGP